MSTLTTRVIYVIDFEEEVTACMIDHAGNHRADTMVCYSHVGQHNICSIDWYQNETKKATPEQYEDLHRELLDIYNNGIEIVYGLDTKSRLNRLSDTNRRFYDS